ncbi:MAG: hypothetical protein KatS3mg029_0344 [Saprospiraceae bacterium]|nr:MAG: hypothetical protein KatS3mg029_0341 [Saprospiraceae bacterium]GIV30993.1 MAG: hypothetical protein KatS3mg029_0344 [Saprospiraceae bacterium]
MPFTERTAKKALQYEKLELLTALQVLSGVKPSKCCQE